MKIEPNMYVRTKDGRISKVIQIKRDIELNLKFYCFEENIISVNYEECELKRIISKASYNIIDLIERFDLVNGHLVICKMYENEKNIPTIVKCVGDYYFEEEDIKSILTKEQFEGMSYKVGD